MKHIIHGLQQFREEVVAPQKAFYQGLAKGQSPETLFITCSDSRISPNVITQSPPGRLFIVRNAGNIIPCYGAVDGGEAASIEYAVRVLQVSDIIVCGHTHCGAMAAITSEADMSALPALEKWLTHAQRTRTILDANYSHLDQESRVMAAVGENVLVQLENLRTHPSVAEGLQAGKVRLHGWIYTVENGVVLEYNAKEERFSPLNMPTSPSLKVTGAAAQALNS